MSMQQRRRRNVAPSLRDRRGRLEEDIVAEEERISGVSWASLAALAADEGAMRKSGRAFHVGELAREYGFTDTDGRRVSPFIIRGSFVNMAKKFEKQNGA